MNAPGLAPEKAGCVPRISEFYGISIYMYWRDHTPPHFHAMYAGWEGEIEISTSSLINGVLPPAALRLLRIWTRSHRSELLENWRRARSGAELLPIAPLE